MSDRYIPSIILLRWVDELTKQAELMEVLHRSVSYTKFKYDGKSDTRTCMGDDELVRIIRDRLTNLLVEIEEVNEGHMNKLV